MMRAGGAVRRSFTRSTGASLGLALDLNFLAMGGVLDPRVSIARASSATYTNSSGLLSTVSSNVARFDYDPTTLALKGLLKENAATNLLLHSQFDSGWTFTSASFTQAAATGPDGVASSAVKLVEAAATAQHFATISAITIVAGSVLTGSVWLKQGERTTATLRLSDGAVANGCSAFFNLATGVLTSSVAVGTGTIVGATATVYPNGWVRCTVTGTIDPATATTARLNIFLQSISYVGDGTSGAFCFGAQAEAGALATSYIPTTTVTVTRPVDAITAATSGFAYNASAGGLAVAYIPQVVADINRVVLGIDDGTAANRILTRVAITTSVGVFLMVASSTTSANYGTANSATVNVLNKQAVTWRVADSAISLNAGAVVTSAAGTPLPTGLTTLRIGDTTAANQGFSGWISLVQYYSKRLGNGQLVSLTT